VVEKIIRNKRDREMAALLEAMERPPDSEGSEETDGESHPAEPSPQPPPNEVEASNDANTQPE
jgi:hypothetical protein